MEWIYSPSPIVLLEWLEHPFSEEIEIKYLNIALLLGLGQRDCLGKWISFWKSKNPQLKTGGNDLMFERFEFNTQDFHVASTFVPVHSKLMANV